MLNAAWHENHRLARGASESDRIAWHLAHQKACGCRPIPAALVARIAETKASPKAAKPAAKAGKTKSSATPVAGKRAKAGAPALAPEIEAIVKALGKQAGVTFGGKGFGSSSLKVDDKIFAMTSSKGDFVVKLPRARVEELVRKKQGKYFDAGRGRLMREWLTATGPSKGWLELAKEALEFGRVS